MPSLTPYPSPRWRVLLLCAAFLLSLLGGCATTGNPNDPFEPLNRGIYKFNDHADNLLIKPAAEIYRGVVPELVRTGVSNFFSNINDVIVALNNLLQGKLLQAVSDVGRIAVNTTLGVLGVFDVATEFGLEKHNEDFGQTLGRWGLASGPYLVLPFLGPSSLRDGVGLLADLKTDPRTYIDPMRVRNQVYGLGFVSRRSELLETGRILETAALDPYEFLRDAYLQRRRNLVYDGNPPEEEDVEIKMKSGRKPGGDVASAAPAPAERSSEASLSPESGESAPAPIKAEALEPAPTPSRARAETAPDPAKGSRVVKIWLPSARN